MNTVRSEADWNDSDEVPIAKLLEKGDEGGQSERGPRIEDGSLNQDLMDNDSGSELDDNQDYGNGNEDIEMDDGAGSQEDLEEGEDEFINSEDESDEESDVIHVVQQDALAEIRTGRINDSGNEEIQESRMKKSRLELNMGGLTSRSTQRIIAPSTKVTAGAVMKLIGVSGATMGELGLKTIQKCRMKDLAATRKKKLLRVFRNIVVKAAYAFMPHEPEVLIAEAVGDLGEGSVNKKELQQCLRSCHKGSTEKRFIRALLHGCMNRRFARDVMAKDVQSTEPLLRAHRATLQGEESTNDDICGAGEGDVGDGRRNGDSATNVQGNDIVEGLSLRKGRKWAGHFRSVYDTAKHDWKHLINMGTISTKVRRRMSIPTESILECVAFIFEPSNRQLLATGSKKIKLHDGEVVELPAVRRTKSRLKVYGEYVERKRQVVQPTRLGRSSFMKIIRIVTSGQQQMKQCVDYCFGVLLYENFRTVKYIVDKRVDDICERNELKEQIDAVSDYLKHGLITHMDKDNDVAHNTRVALIGEQMDRTTTNADRNGINADGAENHSGILSINVGFGRSGDGEDSNIATGGTEARNGAMATTMSAMTASTDVTNCDSCLRCFQVIETVRDKVMADEDGIAAVMDDAAVKLRLFMGHSLRCYVQNGVIDEYYKNMLEAAPETSAIITLDYKMKYEPKKYRQKSSDWYGRKGISWHGSVITYKAQRSSNDNDQRNGRNAGNQLPEVKHKFFDHICANSSEQSTFAVLSILELVAYHMRKENPSITEVVMRTDNAANYHNRVLPVVSPFIFKRYGIRLLSIIHNETQDGKGPADLHFAVATRFVDTYIESRGMDVVTPSDLVNAINHGEGLKGTIGELYEVDEDHSNMKFWKQEQRKKASESAFKILGRCNIIEYCYDSDGGDAIVAKTRAYKYSDEVKWRFTMYSSQCVTGEVVLDEGCEDVHEEEEELDNDGNWDGDLAPLNSEDYNTGVLYCGCLTGARIITTAAVRRQSTGSTTVAKRILGAGTALRNRTSPTTSPISTCTQGVPALNYGTEGVDGQVDLSGDEYCSEDGSTSDKEKIRSNGMFHYCRKCGQSFVDVEDARIHWIRCGAHRKSCHVVDRACRAVTQLIDAKRVVVSTHAEENPNLQKIEVTQLVRNKYRFPVLWAKRPAQGDTLGMNFIDGFKAEVKAMVDRGNADKGKRLSCAQMQEQIRRNHPQRYDIPSVHNIDGYVKSCLRTYRRDNRRAQEGLPPAAGRYTMPERYVACIEQIVRAEQTIMPRFVEEKLMKALNIGEDQKPSDFPCKEQISAKASYIKTKLKKEKSTATN